MSIQQPSSTRRTFLKSVGLGTIASQLVTLPGEVCSASTPAEHFVKLAHTNPEAAGISSEGILAFLDAVEQKVGGLHSFMLLRHGRIVSEGWWEPYGPAHPHMLYSLSKSFTSTAVGLAISEGHLTVDALVTSFFPNELPAMVSDNLANMRVRHLLTMSTGHDKDATGGTTSNQEGNWVKGFLSLPVEHAPGSKFVYNSAATYMLSAIVQKQTGLPVLEYLRSRLFDPLGIVKPTWETCPKGINTGGWGLSIKTEDIARFGQLYLQKGKWNGRQLVPEAWVAAATTKQVSNGDPAIQSDWSQGYCYQFWRCQHDVFRGDGAFGQYCIVMPRYDMVLAITSGVGDMQAVLNAVWDNLLPAIQSNRLPANEAPETLAKRIAGLSVSLPLGKATSPTGKRVSGKTYRFDANPAKIQSASIAFEGKSCTIHLRTDTTEYPIAVGSDKWVMGMAPLVGTTTAKVGVRGVWTDDDTFVAKVCFYETPYIQTMTWKFVGDQVTLGVKANVGFGPTEGVPLMGHAV